MRVTRAWLCALFVATAALVCSGNALALAGGEGGGQPVSLNDGLVIGGMDWLAPGQEAAAMRARLTDPQVADARAASATEYEGLGRAAALALAVKSFPGLIDATDGGPANLAQGKRLGRFISPFAAQLSGGLGSGQKGLVVSNSPIAMLGSHDAFAPIDLRLREGGDRLRGVHALTDASLPTHLGDGARLPSVGLSIVPVNAHGSPLGGAPGVNEGASEFIANTLPSSDTVLKLSTFGVVLDTILRSAASPQRFSFHLKMPTGARLITSRLRPGAISVVKDGTAIAYMARPSAHDAAGLEVPVSVSVKGSTVTLVVAHDSSSYLYPITVDPEFNALTETTKPEARFWPFTHEGKVGGGQASGTSMEIYQEEGAVSGNWGAFNYVTKGTSKIYEIKATEEPIIPWWVGSEYYTVNAESYVEIANPNGSSKRAVIAEPSVHYTEFPRHVGLCDNKLFEECGPAAGQEGNTVRFVLRTTAAGPYNSLFVENAAVSIGQPKTTHSTVRYNTTSPELEYTSGGKTVKTPNAMFGGGRWVGPNSGAFEFISEDAGLGVSATSASVLAGGVWSQEVTHNYLPSASCVGVQCLATQKETLTYSTLNKHLNLVNGNNTIRVAANDPMANTSSSEHGEGEATLKVDTAAPHEITLSGLPAKGGFYEIDESTVNHLTVQASDGEGATPSSGIQSISVYLDGREVGAPAGSCTPGPCTAKGEWSLNGGSVGAGTHTLTVVAKDNAANEATSSFNVYVYHAGATAVGPGSANVESGNFALEATDVDVSGGMGDLVVTRSFQSRAPQAGVNGPLGPQWSIGLGSADTLEVLPDGTVLFGGTDGGIVFSKKSGGGYESPEGDANLTLEAVEEGGKITAYLLKNRAEGTTTKYTLPAGAEEWMPTVSEGPNATNTTTNEYTTFEPEAGKKIVRPILEVAPHPSATCAYKKLEKGCRALEFNYAESTTATGEGQSEWGDYKGDLTRVYFIAWDPSSKEMKTTTVAQYSYDSKGRLRAEWDPRVSPALKVIYGYDAEGHVTALTPPGRETWAFTYGTIAGDNTPGRLLKATQAPASAPLWTGAAASNTQPPSISGTPVVGNRLGVSDGTWSGSPVAYGYQWQDCNSAGAECTPITGATNANYTTTGGDLGHRIVVQVTATNGAGSAVVASAATLPVGLTLGGSSQAIDTGNGLNSVSCVPGTTDCVAADSKGNAFYSTNVSATATATWTSWSGPGVSPSEAVTCPTASLCFMAAGSNTNGGGNLYQAGSLGGSWSTAFTDSSGVVSISCPTSKFCATGDVAASDHWGSTGRFETFTWKGSHLLPYQVGNDLNAISCQSSTYCVIASSKGEIYVATTAAQLESTEWTKTDVDGTKPLHGLACISTTSCVTVDSSGNVIDLTVNSTSGVVTAVAHNIDGTNNLTGVACTTGSICVAVDSTGNVFLSYNSGETWTEQYRFNDDLTSVSCASSLLCVTADTAGTVTAFDTALTSQAVDAGKSLNAISCVPGQSSDCVTSDSSGNLFYTTNASAGTAATWTAWTGPGSSPSESVTCPSTSLCLLAAGSLSGSGGNMYYATSLGGAWTLAYSPAYGVDAISCVSATFCVDTQDGGGYFRYATNPGSTSWTLEHQGSSSQNAVSCLSTNYCVMVDGAGMARVATSTAQIESSTWTETKIDGTTPVTGVACLSTTSCVAVDNAGNAMRLTVEASGKVVATSQKIDGSNSFTGVSCPGENKCTAVDSKGNAFATSNAGETWAKQDHFSAGLTNVYCASVSFCMAADTAGNVDKLAGRTVLEGEARTPQPGTTMDYNVPVSGSGAPYGLGGTEAAKWAQTDLPVTATAVFPPDEPQEWPASDYKRATLYYMDSHARTTNVASPGGAISTAEYNSANETVRTLTAANRAKALEEFYSKDTAELLDTKNVYSEGRLTETLGPQQVAKIVKGNEKVPSGSEVNVRRHQKFYYDEGVPSEFELDNLVTKTTSGALTPSNGELDIRTTTKSYSGQSNIGWKLRAPTSTTVDPEGLKITETIVYDETTGAVAETRGAASTGSGDPRDAVTVYYTAAANPTYPACGEHIEWAGLTCETLPGKQPETTGLPPLPTVTTAYNMWDQASLITESFGSTTRTKETTFDASGRPLTTETKSTNDTPLSAVTDTYDEKSGALVKQSELVEGKEKSIKTQYDLRGRLESYTDADGGSTSYEYDVDGRTTSVVEKTPELQVRGQQTYVYDPLTGMLNELADSTAGKFTATYDVAGRMVSETYPNKMTATFTRNTVGETTGVEYVKTAYCATSCPERWSSDTIVPGIHGEVLKETGTLAEDPKIGYDAAGRLTEVQEVPVGQGCTTRIYKYDAESNRTGLTTRAPGTGGKCATEGGTTEAHSYDSANRLADAGVAYETFGNITKMPAADAGGTGMEITSTYYVSGQLATQEQNGKTTSYFTDPEGRVRETRSPGASITHYAEPGAAVAWVSEPESKWTRDIPGIDGSLAGTQTSAGNTTLIVHDLHGNAVGTAALDEKQTKLLSSYQSTEFGVPSNGTPPKYSWLGALGVASESSSGLVVQNAIAYVPQVGRELQARGMALPIPDRATAEKYEMTLANWVVEGTGAVVRELTEAEEAARAAAEAGEEGEEEEEYESPGDGSDEGLVNAMREAGGGGSGMASASSALTGTKGWKASPHHKFKKSSVSSKLCAGWPFCMPFLERVAKGEGKAQTWISHKRCRVLLAGAYVQCKRARKVAESNEETFPTKAEEEIFESIKEIGSAFNTDSRANQLEWGDVWEAAKAFAPYIGEL